MEAESVGVAVAQQDSIPVLWRMALTTGSFKSVHSCITIFREGEPA
jgi:hypothetical protein